MNSTLVRRLGAVAVTAALSTSMAVGVTIRAYADDAHPDIFSFEAHRTTGANVDYSGQYARWSESQQAYVSAETRDTSISLSHHVPLYKKTQGDPWDDFNDSLRLSTDGTFGGTMKVYPGERLRAVVSGFSSKTGTFHNIASTSSVTLPYYGPSPVHLSKVYADQSAPGAKVFIFGNITATCIFNAEDFGSVSCPLTETMYLQSKINGKWCNVHTYKNVQTADGGIPSFWLQHPKGHLYRYYVPGSKSFKKTYSKVWTTSAYKAL